MLKPVDMTKINVLTLERFVDPLTAALGDAGVVHLVDAVNESPHRLLEGVSRRTDINSLQSLSAKCEYIAELLGIDLRTPETAEVDTDLGSEEADTYLEGLLKEYQTEDESINRLIRESGTLAQRYDQLESFPFRKIRFGQLRDLNFLYMETGRMAPHSVLDAAQALGEKALVLRESLPDSREDRVMVLTSRKNRFATESELKKGGFKVEELPGDDDSSADEEMTKVRANLAEVKSRVEQHRSRMVLMAEKNRARLCRIHASVARALALNRAKERYGRAASLYCVSGWIPARRMSEIEGVITRATNGTAIIEKILPSEDARVAGGEEMVPVQMPECPPLKPFQSLVAGFGAPRYGDLEPSAFVALTFVLMFGIMFGDIGQGAVLALAGFYMLISKRPIVKKYSTHGYFLIFCGISAVFFGFMYGSVFGYENERLLRPVWLHPLHDVDVLLATTIAVGVVCVSAAMIINVYNRLKAHDYYGGLFASFGMLGALFYWGAIGLAVKAALKKSIAPWEVVLLIGIPLLVMFIREPLYNLLTRKKLLHEDLFSFIMTSGVEVMETVMSFLGNTVSFARVGAFALSHAALCFAIYAVVGAVKDMPGSGIVAVFIIVVGNIFVILLEGLVASIQGIRLQYYELFSKYFPGDGVLYKPFSTRGTQGQGEAA